MTISHKKRTTSHARLESILSSTTYCYMFSNDNIFSNFNCCLFPYKFEVLRYLPNDSAMENLTFFSNASTCPKSNMIPNPTVISNLYIIIDNRIRTNFDIVTNGSSLTNNCSGVDFCVYLSTFLSARVARKVISATTSPFT